MQLVLDEILQSQKTYEKASMATNAADMINLKADEVHVTPDFKSMPAMAMEPPQ